MTAHAMTGDREKCLKAGMDDYVAKPISPLALADALEKHLPSAEKEKEDAAGSNRKQKVDGDRVSGPTPEIWDRSAMLDRLMGDEELLGTIKEIFLEDTPVLIEKLEEFLGKADAKSAERQAHSIKGTAAEVGGMALSETAREIEKATFGGKLDVAAEKMPELKKRFERLKQEMVADTLTVVE
jgi:HPt (histidine-containing phosphotransfer) domain-containing protein